MSQSLRGMTQECALIMRAMNGTSTYVPRTKLAPTWWNDPYLDFKESKHILIEAVLLMLYFPFNDMCLC